MSEVALDRNVMDVDRPFWSDGFDMDFPVIFPDARRLLGELGNVQLVTSQTDRSGRLNHPCVWNGDHAMLSFFGFRSPARPSFYCSPSSVEVQCTAWEMFRDAWPHHYLIQVEGIPIWDTGTLRKQFDHIMWDLRGWKSQPRKATAAKRFVMNSYCEAVRAFGRLVDIFPHAKAQAIAPVTPEE